MLYIVGYFSSLYSNNIIVAVPYVMCLSKSVMFTIQLCDWAVHHHFAAVNLN